MCERGGAVVALLRAARVGGKEEQRAVRVEPELLAGRRGPALGEA